MLLPLRRACRRVVGGAGLVAFCLLLAQNSTSLLAAPVHLRAVECSAEAAEGHASETAVDGVLNSTNGWQLGQAGVWGRVCAGEVAEEKPYRRAREARQWNYRADD